MRGSSENLCEQLVETSSRLFGSDQRSEATDPLSVHLTARFGLHSRFSGRTIYVPNTHSAWPLYRARLIGLEDQLVRAAGIEVAGQPESVLFSPGVHTQFGWPRVLHSTM